MGLANPACIDKPIAELYGLDRNTHVENTPMEEGLIIRFLKEKAPPASDEKMIEAGRRTVKNLSFRVR